MPPGRCSGRSTASDGCGSAAARSRCGCRSGSRPGRSSSSSSGASTGSCWSPARRATETVTIEAIADAGEIGLSPRARRQPRPVAVSGRPKEQARLLVAPPDVERDRAPDVGAVSGTRRRLVHPDRRARPRPARAERAGAPHDHRRLHRPDGHRHAARAARPRARSQRRSTSASARSRRPRSSYEVPFYETDVGKGSVKALLTAGAPSSTGHDEERMLRALREIMDRPGIVPMRVGVNTGKVFTGDFGPPYRRAYRVFGDAINTAARVMSKAEPGQILSTEIVLERSRTTFETTPIEPFQAKGKAEPVRASVVGADPRHEGATAAPRLRARRAGRRARRAARRDRRRRGTGTAGSSRSAARPGVGKSRLVEELDRALAATSSCCTRAARSTRRRRRTSRSARRCARCSGSPPEADSDEVERRLREVVARVDPTLVPWIPLLGILLGLDLPPTPETRSLDARFLREQLARRGDALPRLDARGHADDARRRGRPLHGRGERRPPDAVLAGRLEPAAGAPRHALRRRRALGADDADLRCLSIMPAAAADRRGWPRWSSSLTEDDPLSPHDVEEIARRSGGNALFLFELLEAVRATGYDRRPARLGRVADRRRDRPALADRPDGAPLRLGARRELRPGPARGRRERGGGARRRASGQRLAELVDPEPRWSHALPQHAHPRRRLRGASVPPPPRAPRARRRRHRVARGHLARRGARTLALHFHEAQRHDKAWTYCRQAGDRAKRIFANVDAARFYERAATAGRRLRGVTAADLAAVYELLGDVRYLLGRAPARRRRVQGRTTAARDPARPTPAASR